jgi:hypothetical protein
MKRFALIACVPLTLLLALGSFAAELPSKDRPDLADGRFDRVGHGGVISSLKTAKSDTVYLMGGPGRDDGDFQNVGGAPALDGWTTLDTTEPTESQWNTSDYYCDNLDPLTIPNHAWWCGTMFADDCGTGDYAGYGNNWEEWLDWIGNAPNAALSTTVTVRAQLNVDTEAAWDFFHFGYVTPSGFTSLINYTGVHYGVDFEQVFTLNPGDYENGDDVHLRWRFYADGAASDGDCLNPTNGAAQVDMIQVLFNGVQQGTIEDCEGKAPTQWEPAMRVGVGDFAKVWPILTEIDPCRSNNSPQVAFIDDGIVVPGTGGYNCTTWCYGPGGYIVNPEGGLAGPDFYVNNYIISPPLAWPGAAYDGGIYRFDVYMHENLSPTAPGMFYRWFVRSTDDPTGVDGWSGWQDRNTVYYGPPVYNRHNEVVSDLLVPGRTFVQCALSVEEWGFLWGWTGTDGYPAPYFDNVSFAAFAFGGPAMSADELYVAQDNFPEIGAFDYVDLAANSVRFDMARNISPAGDLRNDPGDSLIIDITPVRTGSVLDDLPKLYYKMNANPVFDSIRTYPTEGWIYGDTTFTTAGTVVQDRWNFDLPDTGFFYPGDVIHYYIEAKDNVGGDVGVSLLPPDTTGFSDFTTPLYYQQGYGLSGDPNFTVRALPTFFTMSPGDHPKILFWNDFANRGAENEWSYALQNLGYREGVDFDYYYTNAPDAAEGNGLGGRATDLQMLGYETLLYTCGNLNIGTICNGDYTAVAGCADVQLLDAWLRAGSKNMFLNGDDLAYDLSQSGTETQAFLANWMSLNLVSGDVRPLIGNQATPTVRALTGNSVFDDGLEWVAYGGCLGINDFDAVEPAGSSEMLAEFLTPAGSGGVYPYAAATLYEEPTFGDNIIYMPYGFHYIFDPVNAAKAPDASSIRTTILEQVLLYLGHVGSSPTTDVPTVQNLMVRNYPNPFNPSATISYVMPRSGEISIKLYNARGVLVKVLLQDAVAAGSGSVVWDGTDSRGMKVASGLYFCETKALGQTQVNRMTLVK